MEVEIAKLRKSIDDLAIEENGVELDYRNCTYKLYYSPEGSGEPAEYFASDLVSGADIYLWETLEKRIIRPILFHEVLQADLHIHQRVDCQEAHQIAKSEDRKYAESILSSDDLTKYEKVRAWIETTWGNS